jgi:hypothetical protein
VGPLSLSLSLPSYELFYADCAHTRDVKDVKPRRPQAKGILHIGANEAHESVNYASCVGGGGSNVVFVECDPEVAKKCQANAKLFGQRCIQVYTLYK